MPKTIGSLALAGFDEIFGGASAAPLSGERITPIPLDELHAPDCHPFMVKDDAEMDELVKSVKEYGIREPGIARPAPDGGYELLCGNRRKRACEIALLPSMPVIIRDLDDQTAVLAMVDSNLQHRDRLLPSENAWAYRMKMEALNHNGVKSELNSGDIMAAQTGECKTQIFKTIRLTELINPLLDKVDAKGLAFSPAVEILVLCQEKAQVKSGKIHPLLYAYNSAHFSV